MNKENLFAIIIGLTLGTAVAVGIWTAKNGKFALPNPQFSLPNLSQPQKDQPMTSPTPKEVKSPEVFSLSLTSPENETVVSNAEIEVSGKTNPNATILISQEGADTVISPKSDGTFSTKVILVPGPNSIIVTATDESDNTRQDSRIVIFQEQK